MARSSKSTAKETPKRKPKHRRESDITASSLKLIAGFDESMKSLEEKFGFTRPHESVPGPEIDKFWEEVAHVMKELRKEEIISGKVYVMSACIWFYGTYLNDPGKSKRLSN